MDLDDAVRVLKAAEANVPRAEQRAEERARQIKAEARARVERARQALHEAIVTEYGRGARQVDLVKRTGYTRETIRRILRAAGVEPE